MFRALVIATVVAALSGCGADDVVTIPPYEEPTPVPTPLDGRWVGQSITSMEGATDDIRPSVIVIHGQSNGTRVDGLCPRGEVGAVVSPGATTWGEVRCFSPWTGAEDKTLVFETGALWMEGASLVIVMTGEMRAPGAVNRQARTRFVGERR